MTSAAAPLALPVSAKVLALLTSPAVIIFVSSNVVNVGNLAFNMLFSRWMGPEMFGDLAVVLTIKLAVLGVLGAVGAAVSQRIAAQDAAGAARTGQALARINRICFVALWFALPVLLTLLVAGSVHRGFDLASPHVLLILAASLPFCAPLNVLRGVALGRMDSRKIVLSANVEMGVRLGLAVAAWQAGLGLEGVVAAIALSIVAGWAVLRDVVPPARGFSGPVAPLAASIGLATLPFAVLQVAQVASLDGDIFLAARFLEDRDTGFVAALSLFQRIQFFACFALAGVLLPSVVAATRDGTSCAGPVMSIAGLLALVSGVVIAATIAAPALLIRLMVGEAYVAAAPYLLPAAAAAIAFTANYLMANFLIARGRKTGVAVVAAGAAVQIAVMMLALRGADGGLGAMLTAKLACQGVVFAVLLICVWQDRPRRAR